MENEEIIKALKEYFNTDDVEFSEDGYSHTEGIYLVDGDEYEVCTDEQADKAYLDICSDENLYDAEWFERYGWADFLDDVFVSDMIRFHDEEDDAYFEGHDEDDADCVVNFFEEMGMTDELLKHVDYKKAAQFCLDNDGRGLLASYDGEEHELPNGMFAYRQ